MQESENKKEVIQEEVRDEIQDGKKTEVAEEESPQQETHQHELESEVNKPGPGQELSEAVAVEDKEHSDNEPDEDEEGKQLEHQEPPMVDQIQEHKQEEDNQTQDGGPSGTIDEHSSQPDGAQVEHVM